MSTGSLSSRTVLLVKHAQPEMNASAPPREWVVGARGEEQSRDLARRLRPYVPISIVSSPEPKAMQTARIVAGELGVHFQTLDGLEELDRPSLPIVSRDEHHRLNAPIFETRSVPVLGRESADAALRRFNAALARAFTLTATSQPLVVITHGTVISLFVEQQTGRDAFEVWKSLECGEFVTLEVADWASR
jgi:broad specificity phosphatase PhoE